VVDISREDKKALGGGRGEGLEETLFFCTQNTKSAAEMDERIRWS